MSTQFAGTALQNSSFGRKIIELNGPCSMARRPLIPDDSDSPLVNPNVIGGFTFGGLDLDDDHRKEFVYIIL